MTGFSNLTEADILTLAIPNGKASRLYHGFAESFAYPDRGMT